LGGKKELMVGNMRNVGTKRKEENKNFLRRKKEKKGKGKSII
jgi:hypothetical protein